MDRDRLERLVERGLTQRELAQELGCGQTTVRYWLRRHGLQTLPATETARAAAARDAGETRLRRRCRTHGSTEFVLDRDGVYRCTKCRVDRVSARRRRVKAILVSEAGGACALCGYDRHPAALQFHHVDPRTKGFALGASGLTRALDAMRREAAKCVLLCSNCHAEVEVGFAALPADGLASSG